MALIEVKYFNSFLLRKSVDSFNQPRWYGSRGIPTVVGGWEQAPGVDPANTLNWAIEESRIRGGYNNTSTSLGAKAYLVEDEPEGSIRGNTMIYSGIFNSRTGINQTNQFPVGSDITKSTDPADGSIQRLYAEDTNLIIFSEKKVSRALIDKDAIYTAEGGGVPVSQLNLVIGQIVPYAGNFGIADNPESFAVYGYRKYFVDKNRNAVLRLSRDGITEISNYGMIDYFRDTLSNVDTGFGTGKIIGGWDIYTKQYTLSLQQNNSNPEPRFETLQFDEKVLGWPSFYTFKPRWMFSLANRFYSVSNEGATNDNVFVHNSPDVPRAKFYNVQGKSNITFVSNPSVDVSKVFKTINYEGSNGWEVISFVSDITGADSFEVDGLGQPIWLLPPKLRDTTNNIHSYYEGEYIIDPIQASPTFGQPVYRPGYVAAFGDDDPPYNREYGGFVRKENKYYANLVNNSSGQTQPGEVRFGSEMTGIKAYYCTVTIENDDYTDPGGMKELFAVNTTFVKSS
tara:strand:+ start:7570 stop:9102 length:1533 start_codon:yes stop_codon:yes gene_type:complete